MAFIWRRPSAQAINISINLFACTFRPLNNIFIHKINLDIILFWSKKTKWPTKSPYAFYRANGQPKIEAFRYPKKSLLEQSLGLPEKKEKLVPLFWYLITVVTFPISPNQRLYSFNAHEDQCLLIATMLKCRSIMQNLAFNELLALLWIRKPALKQIAFCA